MTDAAFSPWSNLGDQFLSEGDWAIGQGPDAPDRLLLRHLLKTVGPASLLEVGCGPGIEVDGLRQAGLLERISYSGCDLTPELVRSCRERHPDLRFGLADVQAPLQDSADVVWCRHVLEHVEDGEGALRNLIDAANELAVVSWFIRPTWRTSEIGSGVSEGFLHQTYSARRMIEVAKEGYRDVYRFDFDHHLTRASVWVIGKTLQAGERAALITHHFMHSPEFLDALIVVPEDPRMIELRETILNAQASMRHARMIVDPDGDGGL